MAARSQKEYEKSENCSQINSINFRGFVVGRKKVVHSPEILFFVWKLARAQLQREECNHPLSCRHSQLHPLKLGRQTASPKLGCLDRTLTVTCACTNLNHLGSRNDCGCRLEPGELGRGRVEKHSAPQLLFQFVTMVCEISFLIFLLVP